MATEIEHKYLVKHELWKNVVPEKSVEIKQAYLSTDPGKTIRVRTAGQKGFITIKGKTTGASRLEFEYEIPYEDALQLISGFCSDVIEKTRHYKSFKNKTWEVDEFKGLNAGLIVAEIELASESEVYSKPAWLDADVTKDNRYFNSSLSKNPFISW
jgi:CYTH domain-containing protein